jgi:hypothetical protein
VDTWKKWKTILTYELHYNLFTNMNKSNKIFIVMCTVVTVYALDLFPLHSTECLIGMLMFNDESSFCFSELRQLDTNIPHIQCSIWKTCGWAIYSNLKFAHRNTISWGWLETEDWIHLAHQPRFPLNPNPCSILFADIFLACQPFSVSQQLTTATFTIHIPRTSFYILWDYLLCAL